MPKPGQRKVKYIYGLVDPDTLEVRYIGQTNDIKERLRFHTQYSSALKREAHKQKGKWTQGLLNAGKKPSIVILQVVPFKLADEAERRWIEMGKLFGWSLFNKSLYTAQMKFFIIDELELNNGTNITK